MSTTTIEEEHRAMDSDLGKDVEKQPSDDVSSKPTPAPSAPPPLHLPPAAYWSLVSGWIALFHGFGFINAFGVFESYYKQNIIPSSSDSTISWIGSMQVFLLLASNLVAGPAQDKYGPRPLMFCFAILFAFSCMMISLCHTWWQLFLAQGILQGIALSFGFAPPMACAIAWFKHKSPIAVAVIVSGSSIGGVVWPIIANNLLIHVGFGWTWRIIGFIGLVLLLISTSLVSQPDMYAAQGKEEEESDAKKMSFITRFFHQSARKRPPPRSFFYFDAFKVPAFNAYITSFALFYLGFFYTFFYLPSWGVVYGMSQSLSFYSISILNAASFFGRLFLPFASFRLGPFNTLLICCIITTVIVYASIGVSTTAGVLIIGGFYGFWSGGLISMFAPCAASLVADKTRVGSAVGQLAAVCSVAGLIGPPICGWIIAAYKDPRKGYNGAQGFSAAILTAGTILIFATKLMINRRVFGKA